MDEVEWWEFESAEELAAQAAGDIAFVIQSAIEAHGDARVAVPGDQGADLVHGALVKQSDIDWSKVTLIPTGDRLVPLNHQLSQYRHLLDFYEAKGATVISLVDESALADRREAGRLADARLALLNWPLDLVWLSMGEDGNTAAIYPGPDFEAAVAGPRERRAIGVQPRPLPEGSATDFVTLTVPALSSARAVMISITGDEKKQVLEKAIEEGPLASSSIGRVMSEIDSSIDIMWSP